MVPLSISTGPSATPPEKDAWNNATRENRALTTNIAKLLNAADGDLKFALLKSIEGADANDRKRLEGWMVRLLTHGDLMKLSTAVQPTNRDIASVVKKAKGDMEEHFALQSEIMGIVLDRLAKESSKETKRNTSSFLDPVQEATKDKKAPYRHPVATLPTAHRFGSKPIAERVDQVEEWISGFIAGEGEFVRGKSSALPDFRDIDYAHKTLAEAHAKIDPKAPAEDKEATTLRLQRLELSLLAIERVDPVGMAKKFSGMNPLEFARSHTSGGTMDLLRQGGFVDKNGNPRQDVMERNIARYGGSFNVMKNGGRIAGLGVVGALFIMSAIAVGKKFSSGQTLRAHDYLLALGYGGSALALAGGIPVKRTSSAEKEATEEKKGAEEDIKGTIAEKLGVDEDVPMLAHAAALGMDEDVDNALGRMGGKEKAGVLVAKSLHETLKRYPKKIPLLQALVASGDDVTPSALRNLLGADHPACLAMTKKDVLPEDRRLILVRMMENHIEKDENLLAVIAALEYHP